MADRKPLTVDDLHLLVLSVHREFQRDPNSLSLTDKMIFFARNHNQVSSNSIYVPNGIEPIWVTLNGLEYACQRPNYFSKGRKKYNEAVNTLEMILNSRDHGLTTAEELICKILPIAKDIIAEQKLLEEDK